MCEGTKTLRLFQLAWNTTVLYKIMLHAHFSQIRVHLGGAEVARLKAWSLEEEKGVLYGGSGSEAAALKL